MQVGQKFSPWAGWLLAGDQQQTCARLISVAVLAVSSCREAPLAERVDERQDQLDCGACMHDIGQMVPSQRRASPITAAGDVSNRRQPGARPHGVRLTGSSAGSLIRHVQDTTRIGVGRLQWLAHCTNTVLSSTKQDTGSQKAVTRETLRGPLVHFGGPRLPSPVPVPSPKDPGLRNVFPLSWDPFASYSIPPTRVAVHAQRNTMMAPIRLPRPLSGATDLSDATERISGTDQAIEADVC